MNPLQQFKRATKFTCELCGEELTCPQVYQGKIYGWSCIKKVNPDAKKSKVKEHWIEAESYTTIIFITELDNKVDKITAVLKGKNFIDYNRWVCYTNNNSTYWDWSYSKNIIIQNNKAFINVLAYKNGYKLIEQLSCNL
jgi:hypothetical protein